MGSKSDVKVETLEDVEGSLPKQIYGYILGY